MRVTRSSFNAYSHSVQDPDVKTLTEWMKGSRLKKLTPRETQVLALYLREGDLTKVAEKLGSSIETVKTQRAAIMRKLAVKNVVELTLSAVRRGLVNPNEPKKEINKESNEEI